MYTIWLFQRLRNTSTPGEISSIVVSSDSYDNAVRAILKIDTQPAYDFLAHPIRSEEIGVQFEHTNNGEPRIWCIDVKGEN